ncbi:hypothetical protein K7X08_017561 [Anisodus acutangulus]|uniref:Coronin n=1 Tax=Anisodus acutangulus TaxID=402998 RepID=A0A9Q1R827_9SOLA|nr:hypothetical protein K7X08_017561 [Anisodus acutangulus]
MAKRGFHQTGEVIAREITNPNPVGISFKEIDSLHSTESKLLCCHFHSQRKLLATAGHERKVVIWDLENDKVNFGEGHTDVITDVCFKPNSTVFATSSFDRTVMIWDAAKPSNPFQNLVGHATTRLDWNVSEGDCKLILKGGSRQVRFQPGLGNLLASSTGNTINIFDLETNNIQQQLQGHARDVRSFCLDEWELPGIRERG